MPSKVLLPPNDEAPAMPRGKQTILQRLVWAGLNGLLIFVAFQIYKFVRKFGIRDDSSEAYQHALDVIDFEKRLHSFFELDWQGWALDQGESYIKFFNYLYAYYMWWVIGGFMLLAFFAPKRFQYMRRAFFISMVMVTPMYLLYPLAPPRFMQDHGFAFVDTMQVYGPNYFSETGIVQANRYAAMPSMHVGWTTFVAISVSLLISNRWLARLFVVFMASLITYIVVITGNHYWLDALVGWIFIGTALLINHLIPYPLVNKFLKRGSVHSDAGQQSMPHEEQKGAQ